MKRFLSAVHVVNVFVISSVGEKSSFVYCDKFELAFPQACWYPSSSEGQAHLGRSCVRLRAVWWHERWSMTAMQCLCQSRQLDPQTGTLNRTSAMRKFFRPASVSFGLLMGNLVPRPLF